MRYMQIGKVKVSGLLLFLLFSAAPLLAQTKLAAVPESNTAPVPQEQDHGSGDYPDLVPLRTPQGKAINLECETEPLADSRKVYVILFPTNDGLLMSVYISKPNGDDMVMLREGVLQPDMDHPGSFVEHFKNRVTPLATWLNLSLVAKKPVFRLVLNLPIPPDNTKVKLFPYKGTCHVAGEMKR